MAPYNPDRWVAGKGTHGSQTHPLEEAVCCELVSEVELGKSGFWGSDGKMGLLPRRSAYLRDCYYTYFSNAGIAAAADFPVYQRERWLD